MISWSSICWCIITSAFSPPLCIKFFWLRCPIHPAVELAKAFQGTGFNQPHTLRGDAGPPRYLLWRQFFIEVHAKQVAFPGLPPDARAFDSPLNFRIEKVFLVRGSAQLHVVRLSAFFGLFSS